MRRQGQCTSSGINPMVAGQINQISAQRIPHNSAMNHFSDREETLGVEDERHYMPLKPDGQWTWERENLKDSKSGFSRGYDEGQASESSPGFYVGQRQDLKYRSEKLNQNDTKKTGLRDNNLHGTLEGLEQNFLQDFLKLTKEHRDAEDSEYTRHRERLNEINSQYQEKLNSIHVRQATEREEFLKLESQVRYQQYQQVLSNFPHIIGGQNEAHSLGPAGVGTNVLGEAHRSYVTGHMDSYADGSDYQGGAVARVHDVRGPYPGGRSYNSGGRYF